MNTMGSILEAARWQSLLDQEGRFFSGLQQEAAVGIVPRGMFDSASGSMLVLKRGADGMKAQVKPFQGFNQAGVDMFLVIADDALRQMQTPGDKGLIDALRTLIRQGQAIYYVFKNNSDLISLGYEDLLDALGLAFMGTCLG